MRIQHGGVTLGSRDGAMAKHRLDFLHLHAAGQELGRKRMAASMASDCLMTGDGLNKAGYGDRQVFSVDFVPFLCRLADAKQGGVIGQAIGTDAGGKICLDGLLHRHGENGLSVFIAFTAADDHSAVILAKHQIAGAKVGQFRITHATAQQHQDDGPIAQEEGLMPAIGFCGLKYGDDFFLGHQMGIGLFFRLEFLLGRHKIGQDGILSGKAQLDAEAKEPGQHA